MKKLLLTISFVQRQGTWTWNSLNNLVVDFDPLKESFHDVVKRICNNHGIEMCFNGTPRGNLFYVDKNNQYNELGYHYRGKTNIFERGMKSPALVYWDINVKVNTINNFSTNDLMAA